jgi:glycosyltransferase involved in cell wall biosynthesis
MTGPQLRPSISVIIPCRNERDHIIPCINSVLESDYPDDKLELIVVDGKSTDQTIELISETFHSNQRIKLITNEKQTTPFALNLGIKHSTSEFIMILGAHSTISPNYIDTAIHHLMTDTTLGCAGGLLKSIATTNSSGIIATAMRSAFGVGNSHFRTGLQSGYVDTVAFGVYPRKVLDAVGYFDEELTRNQDDEMSYRLIKSGYRIYLDHTASATYYVRNSHAKLAGQQFQYGYWKVYVNKKHKAITTLRQLVPLFFLLYLISIPIGVLFPVWFTPLFLYLLIAMIISMKHSRKLSDVLVLAFTFPVLHISYGYGYLRGIVDFIFLNKKHIQQHTQLTR